MAIAISTPKNIPAGGECCVEAECHFCYLRGSSVYVHESCCLGVQRPPPTYESRRGFQDGHETYMKQMWCLFYVTTTIALARLVVQNCKRILASMLLYHSRISP